MKKKVTIMGGGNGGSISIRAMKPFVEEYDLSAIIAMSDSGGSSGKLREEFGVLPPGDILRTVIAMSKYDYDTMKRIFYSTRYSKHGKLKGHGLGHLFIAFVEKYNGNIVDAIRPLAQALDVVGPVFPVTLESSDLCVELSNGEIVIGEHEIDRPNYDQSLKINRAWLQPTPMIYERAKQEILETDYLIIGPGSFFTSIVATLLPEGVKDAIRESDAKIIYVPGNAFEVSGETGPEKLSDFVKTLQEYLPRKIDAVMYNKSVLTDKQKTYYTQKNWKEIIGDPEAIPEYNVISTPYEKEKGGLDPAKLGGVLHKYIQSTL